MLIPGAEPFYFPGGPIGCLLVHGFTGSPKEMFSLGSYLASNHYTALGVRLAGHATCVQDLEHVHWRDWLACVEDGYHLLKSVTEHTFVIGLSLGGILALTFASGRFTPNCKIAGVVAMAAPHHLPIDHQLVPFLKIASRFKHYQSKGPSDWFDQEAGAKNICYPVDPLRGAVEVQDVIHEMLAGLPQVSVPVRLIYSKDDHTVRPEEKHADLIFDQIGSEEKELIWIEQSGHNLTSDCKRDQVYKIIADFIQSTTYQPV